MSRKPTIKLSYPDASTLAMQLTDAMIRRAPGKRILETTSEDKAGDGEGSLLDSLNSVRTSTGVEMTLTLEANSMDYALEQLIRPNLTEEEKKSIYGETENELKLETPDQKKKIEIGKISDNTLRDILSDMAERLEHEDAIEVIEETIKEIDYKAGVIEEENPVPIQEDTVLLDMLSVLICGAIRVNNKRITELKTYASNVAHYLTDAHPDDKNVFMVDAHDLADALFSVQHDFAEDANRTLGAETLVRKNKRIDNSREKPTWEDVEKEARKIGQHKTDKTDKTDKDATDREIDPGLLNDIEDGEEGGEE